MNYAIIRLDISGSHRYLDIHIRVIDKNMSCGILFYPAFLINGRIHPNLRAVEGCQGHASRSDGAVAPRLAFRDVFPVVFAIHHVFQQYRPAPGWVKIRHPLYAVLQHIASDGMIRDFEKTTTRVFAMDEADFFRHYADLRPGVHENSYARQWQEEYQEVLGHVPELPFSNTWVAQQLSGMLPDGCVFHLAGSNTAREWNFFPIPKSVICHSNDGTMGIDGQVSAMVGESLASPEKIHMGAVGDLTFFYDMNSIGNRHITSNFRLMIVNNGKGAEFKLYSHPAYQFGAAGDAYMAAAGHFGDKSGNLIRHYAEDLGFEYLCASDKDSFMEVARRFTTVEMTGRPMIFEVFTDSKADSDGLYAMNHLIHNAAGSTKSFMRGMIKAVAGEKGVEAVKGLLRK